MKSVCIIEISVHHKSTVFLYSKARAMINLIQNTRCKLCSDMPGRALEVGAFFNFQLKWLAKIFIINGNRGKQAKTHKH